MPSKPSKASTCPGQCGHRVRLCRFGRPPEVPMRAPRRRKQTARNRPKREQFGRRSAQTRLPLHGRVAGVDRTAAQSWLCESPAVADAIALAARPFHKRGARCAACPRCWRSRRTAVSSSSSIEQRPTSRCICSFTPTADTHAIPAALPSPARAVELARANAALSEIVPSGQVIGRAAGCRSRRHSSKLSVLGSTRPKEAIGASQARRTRLGILRWLCTNRSSRSVGPARRRP
jgi:hypothetical protein